MVWRYLVALCALGVLVSAPADSAQAGSPNAEHRATSDHSAKKKKQRPQYDVRRPAAPFYAQYPFRDPSLGPDGRPYRNPYPPGTCTIDLGYGRFATCDSERK